MYMTKYINFVCFMAVNPSGYCFLRKMGNKFIKKYDDKAFFLKKNVARINTKALNCFSFPNNIEIGLLNS